MNCALKFKDCNMSTHTDGVATAALVISIVAGVVSFISILYKATITSYDRLRMDCIRIGRAKHIIRKFNSADDDDTFKKVLRLCVMNAEVFCKNDVKRLLSCLHPYWDTGLAENEVHWLFSRLISANNCDTLMAITDFITHILTTEVFEYNFLFRQSYFDRVVHSFRNVFLHFTASSTSNTNALRGPVKSVLQLMHVMLRVDTERPGSCCIFSVRDLYFTTKFLLKHPNDDLYTIVRAMCLLPKKISNASEYDQIRNEINVFDVMKAVKDSICTIDGYGHGSSNPGLKNETLGLLYIRFGNTGPQIPFDGNLNVLSIGQVSHNFLVQLDASYSISQREANVQDGFWQRYSIV